MAQVSNIFDSNRVLLWSSDMNLGTLGHFLPFFFSRFWPKIIHKLGSLGKYTLPHRCVRIRCGNFPPTSWVAKIANVRYMMVTILMSESSTLSWWWLWLRCWWWSNNRVQWRSVPWWPGRASLTEIDGEHTQPRWKWKTSSFCMHWDMLEKMWLEYQHKPENLTTSINQ